MFSEAGEGWSDGRIIRALETSASMIYRVRKQLVEEGFEAVLSRKPRATPAVPRIFDGEKEAKLIALACSKPPGLVMRIVDSVTIQEEASVEIRRHGAAGRAFVDAVHQRDVDARPRLGRTVVDPVPARTTVDVVGDPVVSRHVEHVVSATAGEVVGASRSIEYQSLDNDSHDVLLLMAPQRRFTRRHNAHDARYALLPRKQHEPGRRQRDG